VYDLFQIDSAGPNASVENVWARKKENVFGSSAVSGAAIAMTGAHALLPDVGLFDLASGNLLPALLAVVLALTGIGWQFSNIKTWGQSLPPNGEGKRSLGD
jgi:hypothetical protein